MAATARTSSAASAREVHLVVSISAEDLKRIWQSQGELNGMK